MSPELLQGVMSAVGSWGSKGHEDLMAELKTKYNEPWMTQNAISTYADMWVIKEALEKAGKADREAVAQALRTMDGGPSKFYPGGLIKFDDKGRRVDAGLTIIQWQTGVPVTVFPPDLAVAKADLAEEVDLPMRPPGGCAGQGICVRPPPTGGGSNGQADVRARTGDPQSRCSARSSSRSRSRRPTTSTGRCRSW